jgi:hypothetical protein
MKKHTMHVATVLLTFCNCSGFAQRHIPLVVSGLNNDLIFNGTGEYCRTQSFTFTNFPVQGIGRLVRSWQEAFPADGLIGNAIYLHLYDDLIKLLAPYNKKILTFTRFTKASTTIIAVIFALTGVSDTNILPAMVATLDKSNFENGQTTKQPSLTGYSGY